ncbi:hypothetical protein [Pseudomonas sp. SBB6]|uniref:hypothetical protein n=1 Tax=Pseudomonas sp. SBB6 TaxID=2962032 RepID=UPI0020B71D08|nr:hypothetical protein [Pseudomonas sp. SBB6]MCP3752308.1 hypothetical protein [Pseudomonas sp. SBB6]
MTINIAVATRDAIILGCDSLSSVVETAAFPLRNGMGFARDVQGNEMVDAEGRRLIPVGHVRSVVTNVYGGVSKMFSLYENDGFSVAAVTAGKATLCGLTVAEWAKRFCYSKRGEQFTRVEEVANQFLAFIRIQWETDVDFENTDPSLRNFLPPLQFIVAGHCPDDHVGRVFKLDVTAPSCIDTFPDGDQCGATWAGQSDFVERLLLGVDHGVRHSVQLQFDKTIQDATTEALTTMVESLTKSGVNIPEGFEMDFPGVSRAPSWESAQTDIQFSDLSTQYAIEFVELLVNTQSGMQRFGSGIPTVGGRTHIGVLRRGEGFRMLNEPELTHNHTGYSHDL